ncbi:hypothetical protein Vretifemale_11941 [Volvox reticuliferus]|uniref:Uncharacterized protein n=2 Tax=Volvox reticuliferus TaxID=1737510 RepID=A0A8J4FP28_9CHLO|nr:hypothetical protein Vretifemale_11941 [Volvox reticuliferus]
MDSCLRALALVSLVYIANGARLLSSTSVFGHMSTAGVTVRDAARDFDYFMFVRQWPGSFCSKHACPLVSNHGFHFTIHGLWPNRKDGTWPQFCDTDYDFEEDKIDDLLDELKSEWPTVYDSYEEFWDHEWSKHGTCALDVFPSEHSYFKSILRLHRQYDLAAALGQAGIVPSTKVVYRTKDLSKAIYDMYGVRPLVHCSNGQLSEIWICIDKKLQPFDCDASHEHNPCQKVTIPPFSTN